MVSSMVRARHFNLAHGMGRSGDIAAVQPKAAGAFMCALIQLYLTFYICLLIWGAGSSLIVKLTNSFLLDFVKICGVLGAKSALCLPLATGMAITTTFLGLKAQRPAAKFIIWSRIDQKTCFKVCTHIYIYVVYWVNSHSRSPCVVSQ